MKIQISRNSKQTSKRYSSVCHQQGRMLIDSDLTEQALISRDRLNNALRDVIGSGTPRHDGLLRIEDDGSPGLYWGRVYVDGVPAEAVADETAPDVNLFDYTHQLFYPEAPALPDSEFRYYVDVWERSVLWLEDEMLRDPGLHGADTTARTQTVAQVKWCAKDIDPLCIDVNPPTGNALLRLVLRSLSTSDDPCDPCAQELGLNEAIGNYLFRVEVHDVHYDETDRADSVILKWSSENGAEAYKTSDVPPDFSSSQYVYEYFDDISEKRLGTHLARDVGNERIIDGKRADIESDFSATSASAKDYTRRWDGWCKIDKTGSDWQVTQGFEGSIDLASGIGAGKPGHVVQGGDSVTIELRVITQTIELKDFDLIAGDYWTVPVREAVHQQGEVLLEGDVPGVGALPEGEPHHYMLLIDVANDEDRTMQLADDSDCDVYNACLKAQFPSLTDLHADDICYDNEQCNMPEVSTVQDALDYLCLENDLPWHNKHLHGWGIVCGLALECNKKDPQSVILQPGYALDCEGRDMIIKKPEPIDIMALLKEAGIDPGNINRDEDQGLCLYLDYADDQTLEVNIALHQAEDSDWTDMFADSLLMDFYEDCVLELFNIFTDEMRGDQDVTARCAVTECGKKLLAPLNRRTLAIINLVFNDSDNAFKTILNVSPCEHSLLKDLYDKIKDHLRSKTFCGQFKNIPFPEYPFKDKKTCRGTWFTPESLDHIRLHPDGTVVFGWQSDSSRIFVFKQLKEGCVGDVIGFIDVPRLDDGTITDLVVNEKNMIYVSAIIHREDSVILMGEFDERKIKDCSMQIDWKDSFICGVKITRLELSPWSGQHIYAVALCKGVYLFEVKALLENEKIEIEPMWQFEASGHIKFDKASNLVMATAYERQVGRVNAFAFIPSCATGFYNGIVFFDGKLPDKPQQPEIYRLFVNDAFVQGNDGFDVSISSKTVPDDRVTVGGRINISQLYLYIVVNENDTKSLCMFDIRGVKVNEDKVQLLPGLNYHSFGVAKKVSVSYISNEKFEGILASRFAMHDLQFIPGDPRQYKKLLIPSIPVQVGPVEIQTNDAKQEIYVLNHVGQSVTVFNYALQTYHKEREILAQYRRDVIAAFQNLVYGLFQYLKDCFCHHLLVNCPDCDKDEDKVYLGCLSIEDNEVYHICNFTKRKYVKSFPTVSYWMSLIPVEALIGWAVEHICCYVFPAFGRTTNNDLFSIGPMQTNMAKAAVQTDRTKVLSTLSTRGGDLVQSGISDAIGTGFKNRSRYEDSLNLEYNYKPGVFIDTKTVTVSNDLLLERMEIINQDRLSNTQSVDKLSVDMVKIQQEKAELETRFTQLDTEKQAADKKVALLEKEITGLKLETTNAEKRFVEFEKSLSDLEKMRNDVQPILNGARSVSEISGISAKNLELLENNNIKTLSSLATMSKDKLVEMGITVKTATSLISKANGIITTRTG